MLLEWGLDVHKRAFWWYLKGIRGCCGMCFMQRAQGVALAVFDDECGILKEKVKEYLAVCR